uniref:Uncharacterized protein n=1 Tax=Aegilops tauschii subsp. strangulata TaxID=200361 RepID=A0A453H9U3_AEGTS
ARAPPAPPPPPRTPSSSASATTACPSRASSRSRGPARPTPSPSSSPTRNPRTPGAPFPICIYACLWFSRSVRSLIPCVRRKIGLLAGGDLLCLLIFSAIGRLSHGLPVLDAETFKTADPFIAGWLLSAYLLGGFGDDAKGSNGVGNAVTVAAKSWAVGIPLGIAIRSVTAGHIPQIPFVLVAMGSTGVLLTAWRALISQVLSAGQSKKDDVYRKGNPFELFELLTSLVRRW